MVKSNLDITEVHELYREGKLDEAKQGYLSILRKNPRYVEVLHALAILCARQNNIAEAIDYLTKAVEYEPNNPTLQLHLANTLKLQGLYQQAIDVLNNTLKSNPNYVPAINNLGTVYFALGNLDQAIECYNRVLKDEPAYIDAYYNLGLALTKKEKLNEAKNTFEKLLKLSPEHFAARFHLACIEMKLQKFVEAKQHFLMIEKTHPHHFETQTNLATCYLKQGLLNDAKYHYLKAIKLMPNDIQVLFNLGTLYTEQGHVDSAIQSYQKAIKIDPDFFAAHNNLGTAFLAKQHPGFALHHFQEALRLQPNNSALRYSIKVLSKNQRLLAAPADYIASLFDSYADHYEQHLLQALDYNVPILLKQNLESGTKLSPSSLDILDLGSGTGLCGEIFKTYARTLIGVDLSIKMLDVAREKNIYTDLIVEDVTQFLKTKKSIYDLIIAGDVLVYIGDLSVLFQHVSTALKPNGIFVFNTEISDATDFQMNQSGRFAHQKKYIEQLAQENNLKILNYTVAMTRQQNNQPVYGHIFSLQRYSSSR